MTRKINFTAAKIRRLVLVAALVVCPFLALQPGNAQTVTGTLTQTGTGLNNFTITNNQQFQLTLMITTDFISSGITYFLETGANGTGLFRIVGRDFSMSPYPDPTTSNANAVGGAAGLLNPRNMRDLGGTTDFPSPGASGPGTFTLGILTLDTLNAPNGTYTIFLSNNSVVTQFTQTPGLDPGQGTYQDRFFTGQVLATINVVPEPATIGLAVMGGGMLLLAGYRKHRARSRS